MVAMGKVVDPMKTAQTMKEFEKQNFKMNMTEEMSLSIISNTPVLIFSINNC